MELRKFIKSFTWNEIDRDSVTLGPNTRIENNRAVLGTYGVDDYPTSSNLYVKSWVANPRAVRQWLGFEATVIHKKVDGEQVTSAGFRLSDGTSEYYWNGSDWVVGASVWNSEEDVASHISAFPATSRKLQVVVNLSTTDETVTPELIGVKVLFGAVLDSEIEDLIERSLIPLLRETVRPVTRFVLAKTGSDNQIDLTSYQLDSDYRIVGVDSVFNDSVDPGHDADLFESFTTRSTPEDPWHNGTVAVITLNDLVNDGDQVWLRLRYEPVVTIQTSRDWYELGHLPALVIESVSYDGNEVAGENYVGNKADGTAVVVPTPLQGTLSFELAGFSDKLFDHEAFSAAVTRFFGANDLLVSTGLDERYTLSLVTAHEFRATPDENDLHTWRKIARVDNFRVWYQEPRDDYLVKRLLITGSVDATVE